MKIKKADRENIREQLVAWAKKNKAKVEDSEHSIFVIKGDERLEVIAEDGWAYVHGGGSLSGASTNISSIDQFDSAVKKLRESK
jgi:hypothetical protein